MSKLAKSAYSPFVALVFKNVLEYRNSNFKMFNGDLATSIKCGKLRSSNSRVYEAKTSTPLVDQQFNYVCLAALQLDSAGSKL